MTALNKNNSAVKRIMQEARELANDPCTDYSAGPLEDDIFEWHCTLRGPTGTEFESGLYHFRILLPAEYPFRPPSIMILTPNGRFELNTKICISFTNYHEELWQPAWGVRTAIIGLQGFFPLKGQAAVGVGSIEYPATERKRLAALSREWTCPHCKQTNLELLPDPPAPTATDRTVGESSKERSNPPPVGPLAPAAAAGEDADQTTIVQAPILTEAEQNQMEAMARALHDRLDTLQSRGHQPEILDNSHSSIPQDKVDPKPSVRSSDLPPTAGVETPSTPASVQEVRAAPVRSSQKPPLLLDTAICFLLVLLFAIICRRMV
jgi:ubiquitin-conjugating enzyme E2 J1